MTFENFSKLCEKYSQYTSGLIQQNIPTGLAKLQQSVQLPRPSPPLPSPPLPSPPLPSPPLPPPPCGTEASPQGGWRKACQSPSKANLSRASKEAELSLK